MSTSELDGPTAQSQPAISNKRIRGFRWGYGNAELEPSQPGCSQSVPYLWYSVSQGIDQQVAIKLLKAKWRTYIKLFFSFAPSRATNTPGKIHSFIESNSGPNPIYLSCSLVSCTQVQNQFLALQGFCFTQKTGQPCVNTCQKWKGK